MKNKGLLLSLLAFGVVSTLTMQNNFTIHAEGNVAISSLNASDLAGGWELSSSFVEEGIKVRMPGADSVGSGAWQRQLKLPNSSSYSENFTIKDGNTISFEFSANLFDESGNVISQSVNAGNALDIYMFNAADDSQISLIRIWTNSASYNNGTHSYELYYGSGWNNKVEGSTWIVGDAMASSSFYLQFDTTNLFQSYVGGSEELVTLDNDASTFFNNAKSTYNGVEEVYFKIYGNNGFTNTTDIVIKSINGQSLSNTNGNIVDNVAPTFKSAVVSSSITLNEPYTIPTEAYDLLSDVEYYLEIDDKVVNGKTFTATKEGTQVVTLCAKDANGNVNKKEYTFTVAAEIDPPVISSVHTIKGGTISLLSYLEFDMPEYSDDTGSATVELEIYCDDKLFTTLQPTDDGKFRYFVPTTFEGGVYEFSYKVTNIAGSTSSERKAVTYMVSKGYSADFVTIHYPNTIADYVDDGLRIRSSQSYVETELGIFDISRGFDIKYLVPEYASNGQLNDTSYFDLIFTNVTDGNYRTMFRVWTNNSGADRPTNVYYSTNDWATFTDVTDTGWISRTVDDTPNKYHMAYSVDETFIGERTGGMQRVDKAYNALSEFFTQAPSSYYSVRVETSRLDAPSINNFETIITDINGQSLKNSKGVMSQVNDAKLYVDGVNEKVQINDSLNISTYAEDIFANVNTKLVISKPDGNKEEITIENKESKTIKFDILGEYKLQFTTVGTNGKEVKEERTVECKSSTADISISINGNYNAQYAVNDSITILDTTKSENIVKQTITILTPSGISETVTVGGTYKFNKPGIYTIVYVAEDDAQPTPNSTEIKSIINVPDTTKPLVALDVADAFVNQNVTIAPTITEDSEYDVKITIKDENNSILVIKSMESYTHSFDKAGIYKITVVVEDIYGNKETINKDITIKEESQPSKKKGCKGVATTSFISLFALAGALLLKKKK